MVNLMSGYLVNIKTGEVIDDNNTNLSGINLGEWKTSTQILAEYDDNFTKKLCEE